MLIVLSPAKKMTDNLNNSYEYTTPKFLDDSKTLVNSLKKFTTGDLMEFMEISEKIAELNVDRLKKWKTPLKRNNATQAIFAFNGDVYAGLEALTLKSSELKFAQNSIRILSGLYGVLRPLDLILPYRLEMGRKLKTKGSNSLYEFWKEKIVADLNSTEDKILINLASNEYFKSIDQSNLNAEVITPQFKDKKGDKYKIISFHAKKARGMMARFIIDNKIKKHKDLIKFNYGGYKFSKEYSSETIPVFLRD